MVMLKSALLATAVTTAAVLLPGVLSGVVLVAAAVLVMLPVAAVTLALTIRVRVWPMARLSVAAVALEPATLVVPWLELALIRLRPALITSVIVTFWALLGPKLTTVTV